MGTQVDASKIGNEIGIDISIQFDFESMGKASEYAASTIAEYGSTGRTTSGSRDMTKLS